MLYNEHYSHSWALIIGINHYRHAPPLAYARNDAEAIREALLRSFSFADSNIILLLDEEATRESIVSHYLGLVDRVEADDRIVFFYAGHGHTVSGRRGETGFLFPVDGSADNLSTLVRWDDLTKNADLIPAKHMLFIMDACYGGLAVTRYVPPGSMRFLKDMLQRYSRQVLTAGKANEVVADSGGPRDGHSIFTGHLLDALDGAASNQEGVLTAGGVIAYVYDRVANDQHSGQTPHYGSFDGDGDLILLPNMPERETGESTGDNILVEIPPTLTAPMQIQVSTSLESRVKEYLSGTRYRIALDDLVNEKIRQAVYELGSADMSMQGVGVTTESFVERLQHYESCMVDLRKTIALISRWGDADQQQMLAKILARIGEVHEIAGGQTVWLGLRWYSLNLLLYTAGISALSSSKYSNLKALLTTPIQKPAKPSESVPIIIPTIEARLDVTRAGAWKLVPGHENNHVPESEYAFKETQPLLEDLFFLGKSYEGLFDRYEMLMSLSYADLTWDGADTSRVWGPAGRFWWKYSSLRSGTNPLSEMLLEASSAGDAWPPIKAGLFKGSYKRFAAVADGYEETLKGLRWF